MGALSLLMTGCNTYLLVQASSRRQTEDTFVPIAVYQAANSGNFALAGRFIPYRAKPVSTNARARADSYLIIPPTAFGPEAFPKDPWRALRKIEGLPPYYAVGKSKIKSGLSPDYFKICSLPPTTCSLVTKRHHPDRIKLVFLPLTVAADTAFFPFTWWGYCFLTTDWC